MVVDQVQALSRAAIQRLFVAGAGPDTVELDELFAEVRRRSASAPTIYPFREVEERIEIDASVDQTVYLLLLYLSFEKTPFRREKRFHEINPTFDLLVREALRAYAGSGSKGVRFGWKAGDDRPEHLADAVRWLAGLMKLPVGTVDDDVDEDDKDGGVDVVVWSPFDDGLPGFSIYLAQCTVQIDFDRKGRDVNTHRWSTWIQAGRSFQPALGVPFAVAPDAKVRKTMSYDSSVFLDRLRICASLKDIDLKVFPEVQKAGKWLSNELNTLRLELSEPTLGSPAKRMKKKGALKRNLSNAEQGLRAR